MDISTLTTVRPATSSVASASGNSPKSNSSAVAIKSQLSTTVGNSLPDARQVRGRDDASLPANPVTPSSPEELNNLVAQANVTLQGRSSDLKFTVAEGTDISVVRIEDAETGELIRQVPSEAMVAIARALDEVQRGMVLEEKV